MRQVPLPLELHCELPQRRLDVLLCLWPQQRDVAHVTPRLRALVERAGEHVQLPLRRGDPAEAPRHPRRRPLLHLAGLELPLPPQQLLLDERRVLVVDGVVAARRDLALEDRRQLLQPVAQRRRVRYAHLVRVRRVGVR